MISSFGNGMYGSPGVSTALQMNSAQKVHLQSKKSIWYLKRSRLTGSGNLVLQCSNQQEMREQGLKNRKSPHPPCTKGYPTQPPFAVVYIKYIGINIKEHVWPNAICICTNRSNLHLSLHYGCCHLNLSDLNQISNKVIKEYWILQLPWFLQILKFSDPSIVAKLNSDNRDTI
jgi:hypothetical protein